jgi:hypothetical protein
VLELTRGGFWPIGVCRGRSQRVSFFCLLVRGCAEQLRKPLTNVLAG